MLKCDSCGQFGDVEEVTITIKKHKECDVNGAFGQKPSIQISTQPPVQLPKFDPNDPKPIAFNPASVLENG